MPTAPASIARRAIRLSAGVAIVTMLSMPAAAQSAAPFHMIAAHILGGDGGWDYVALDTAFHRLFVTRGDRVMVIDEQSGKLLSEITGLHRTHGVAFDYHTSHGFVTGSGDSSVTMFDLATLKVLATTKGSAGADGLIFDDGSSHVFSLNGAANSASVIDGTTGALIATIPLGGRPEFGASDGKGKLFVNLEDSSAIVEIDSKHNRVVRHWALAPCESPSGLAIDVAHHRLFSGCDNKMMAVSDYETGKVMTTIPIGGGVDANRYDPATGLAFSSNGEGSITVAKESSSGNFTVAQTISTSPGARTMELDRVSHRLFTVTARFGAVPEHATADNPRKRPPILPNSFVLLVYGQ